MLTAIDFDDQARFDADEVGNVWADRMLALEFQPVESFCLEVMLDDLFGIRLALPQFAGVNR